MIHDPAGCGLSWLPFWVCNFLSKFYNGFLSWWWNLISVSVRIWMWVPATERLAQQEKLWLLLKDAEVKRTTLTRLCISTFLRCSLLRGPWGFPLFHCPFLKDLTWSSPLLPALGCPGVISLRFLIVRWSIRSPLPQCLHYYLLLAFPFTLMLTVTFTAALGLWRGAVNAVVCFCSRTDGCFPAFSTEMLSYHPQHAEECGRNAYGVRLAPRAQCVGNKVKVNLLWSLFNK